MSEIRELQGEVLAYVDIAGNEIRLTTQSGRVFNICHHQDCCESVGIEDIEGNWIDLIGKPIIEATEDNPGDEPPEGREYAESYTWTVHRFRTDSSTVVTRWFGESNGYYGEGVDIDELAAVSDAALTPPGFDTPTGVDWLIAADYWHEAGDEQKSAICRVRGERSCGS